MRSMGCPADGGSCVARFPSARVIRSGAVAIVIWGLLFAHLAALGDDLDTAQLPVAYALATAGTAIALRARRTVPQAVPGINGLVFQGSGGPRPLTFRRAPAIAAFVTHLRLRGRWACRAEMPPRPAVAAPVVA